MAGRVTRVDQEIAVHFRYLGAADAQAPATRGVDQLPGAVTGRVLECRAAGFFADRLRGLAVVLHLVHPRPNFIRRGNPPTKACRGKNHGSIDAAVAVDEFHVRIGKNMFLAVAADAVSATRLSSAAAPALTISPSAPVSPKPRGLSLITTPGMPPSRTIRLEPTPTT